MASKVHDIFGTSQSKANLRRTHLGTASSLGLSRAFQHQGRGIVCFGFQRGASMDRIGSRTSHRCSIGLGSEDFGVQVNGSNSHIPRAICEQVLVDRGVPLPRWVKGPLVPRQNSPL